MSDDVRVSDRLTIPAAEPAGRFARAGAPGRPGVGTTDAGVRLSASGRGATWPTC